MKKQALILVEGSLDRVFHKKLFEKALDAKPQDLKAFENLLKILKQFRKVMWKPLQIKEFDVLIVSCGGFDAMRFLLRTLLSHEEFPHLIEHGVRKIFVAADADKDVWSMVEGVLSSLRLDHKKIVKGFCVKMGESSFEIRCVESGRRHEYATQEVEDLIEEAASEVYSNIAAAITALEDHLGRRLNSKQKVGAFAALTLNKPHVERFVAKAFDDADAEEIRRLEDFLSAYAEVFVQSKNSL